MLRAALLMTAALSVAAPAFAQEKCAAGPNGVTEAQYVEARRPVMAKRKLAGEERSEANKLMSDIKAALKKKGRPEHAQLDRLAVLGGAGDRELMKVLVDGYDEAGPVNVIDGGETWVPRKMLAGLWAIQLYRDGEKSKAVSKAIDNCLGKGATAYDAKVDGICGFSASIQNDYKKSFHDHWTGEGGLPKSATFTEYALVQTPEQEIARFEKALIEYRDADGGYGDDYGWAACWSNIKGGDYRARWLGSSQIASANYATGELNKQTRAKAEIDQKAAQWAALQTKRVEARNSGGKLSEADEGDWAGLSFWLGGKYLLPYASETVLIQETAIRSLCDADSGKICQRQRQLFQYRSDNARSEQNIREGNLRNLTLGGGDVTVRNYDQNGNYLGTTTMPAWQADIAGAN